MLNQDIIREATRLTRAGQLVEATALLQRMLRGESATDTTSRTGSRIALREPLIIDAKANAVEETDSHPQLKPAISAQPRTLRALLDRKEARSGIELRGVMKRAPLSTPDIVPEGARFIESAYSSPAGSRAYRLFIPSRYQERPLPLVVMLHGCTQSPDDFAAGTRMNFVAEEQKCFVVYPAQHSKANQAKCWNWFRTADQQRDRGEPSLIAGITRQIMHDYSVDQRRVYVGGLSAGAAAAAIMGATYKDLYAAVGIHSGLACGAATDIPSAFAAMRQGGGPGRRVRGAHTLGFNGTSTGVSVIGNFEVAEPPREVIGAIIRLAAWKLDRNGRTPSGTVRVLSEGSDRYPAGTRPRLPVIDGHRDTNQTACPGRLLYDDLPRIRNRTQRRVDRF